MAFSGTIEVESISRGGDPIQFTLYDLEADPTIRISLAYEVDCYFWKKQNLLPQWITSTRSMGHALRRAKTDCAGATIQKPVNRLHEDEWNDMKKQAKSIYPLLNGRFLLWPEVIALLHKHKVEYREEQLAAILQYLYLHNHVTWTQGVKREGAASTWSCNRCFASYTAIHPIDCATCEEECAMCEQCLLLGRSRTCSLLLQFSKENHYNYPDPNPRMERGERYSYDVAFAVFSCKSEGRGIPEPRGASRYTPHPISIPPPNLTLTPAQSKVSEQVNEFLDSPKTQALVWAVTGAGKTEMLVPSVWKVLSAGGKVLWVTPRKDVVIEIAPRLREFFPTVRSVALYGGSEDAWGDGNLVISTAHQAWRYYQAFDLVIVDEVDAFPLYGNESLEKGIRRALSPHAKQVYLTATPPQNWKSHISRTSSLFILPVRFHEQPLPVPHLVREWLLERKREKGLPILPVSQFVQKVRENEGQAFIFVPRTRDIRKVVDWFVRHGALEEEVTGVSSHDPQRKEKVEQFRAGMISFLVTTTILERGVTVPRCFVLVWGADHPVFDQASLIQIAGRVGRSRDYQQGEVVFLGAERTESQRKAKKEIEWLNQQAKKEGFLKKAAYIP